MQVVPFSIPHVPKAAFKYIEKALSSPIQQGNGPFSRDCESIISSFCSRDRTFLTPSCTAALEIASMLIDLGPGDEVILPSFTFTSAVTAVTKFNATPVFCDIDMKTGCIDVNKIEELISSNTKAISYVNYAGLSPDVDRLKSIAERYDLLIIEDAAHNFGVLTYNQKALTGDFVAFSFHATKNIQCGEGGALNVGNEALFEKTEIIREKGTNRSRFVTGKVNKYNWVGKGSSYLLSEVNSAILMSSLDTFTEIQNRRETLVDNYNSKLEFLDDYGWQILGGTRKSSHMYALMAPDELRRNQLADSLKKSGITAVSHYEDLSTSPEGIRVGKTNLIGCLNAIEFSKRILRLPLYADMSIGQLDYVVSSIKKILIENIKK